MKLVWFGGVHTAFSEAFFYFT